MPKIIDVFKLKLTLVLGDQELHIIEASSSNRLWNGRKGISQYSINISSTLLNIYLFTIKFSACYLAIIKQQ